MAVYIYLVVSAALVLISDIFMSVFREPYSWWLVPLLSLAASFAFALVLRRHGGPERPSGLLPPCGSR